MSKKLYTINTFNNYMDTIFNPHVKPYAEEKDIEVYNILDDSLLKATVDNGGMTEEIATAMLNYAKAAQSMGADGVLVTCTSVNEATEAIKPFLSIPIMSIEEPLIEQAVQNYKKIGIIASLPTAPIAIERVLNKRAAEQGKEIELKVRVAEGAFARLNSGDRAGHDELVCKCLYELAKEVECIVFAQISMSLLKHEEVEVPLLKLGRTGLVRIDELMNK